MARSVVLLTSSGTEATVSKPGAFVQAVYGRGWQPKTGDIQSNYLYLTGDREEVDPNPLRPITAAELESILALLPGAPNASTTTKGLIEIATQAEAVAGTSSTLALTPAAGRAAFVSLNQQGQLVIVVDGNETVVGGGGGGLTLEQIQDAVAAMILTGSNVTKVYDDAAGTLTLSATSGGSTDQEVVRDTIAAALVAGAGITITPNDAGDTITISSSGVSANATGAANNPVTSASAARPTGLTRVYWYTPTQPTNAINGDVWEMTV